MRGNSGSDKGSNADKKSQKERYPRAPDVKANKACITKGENKGENKGEKKGEKKVQSKV